MPSARAPLLLAPHRLLRGSCSGSLLEGGLDGMALERARRGELSEFVADHLLGHIHGNKFPSVVDGDGVPDHIRHDRRPPRPRFQHFLFVARIQCFDFDAQVDRPQRDLFSLTVPSLPYSSTRRKRPHWACRIFLNPRTGPGTRCDFGQNGQTKRVPSAFGMRSTITAQPGLHSLYSTGSGGATTLAAGLATGFDRRSFYASLHGPRPASRGTCGSCSCRSHGCRFLPAVKVHPAGFCVVSRSTLGALVQDRAPSKNIVSFWF